MLAKITWPEFQEWMAFAELEPFDEQRADIRAATLEATMLNIAQAGSRRAKKLFEPLDVMLHFGDDIPEHKKHKQTWQEQKGIGMMIAKMFGVQVERKAK